mgnify:CR=1 FL=1|jgi:hypothetical protein
MFLDEERIFAHQLTLNNHPNSMYTLNVQYDIELSSKDILLLFYCMIPVYILIPMALLCEYYNCDFKPKNYAFFINIINYLKHKSNFIYIRL